MGTMVESRLQISGGHSLDRLNTINESPPKKRNQWGDPLSTGKESARKGVQHLVYPSEAPANSPESTTRRLLGRLVDLGTRALSGDKDGVISG